MRMYMLALSIALLLIVLAVVLAICAAVRWKQGRFWTPMKLLFTGLLLSGVILFLPVYQMQKENFLFALVMAVYTGIQMFAFNGDNSFLLEAFESGTIDVVYFALSMGVMIVAPALTASAVISIFNNVTATISFFGAFYKDIYVFSRLNEGSLALAKDLKKKNSKIALIFTGVNRNDAALTDSLCDVARELGAICFKKEIQSLNYRVHDTKHGVWFFTISENEKENMNDALQLVEKYGDLPNARLYAFCCGPESEVLLSSAHSKEMKVRRVNRVRSLISRTLFDDGDALFRDAIPAPDGKKEINVLVVGLGDHGTNMVKALSWYCQMDGYRVHMDAYDLDPLAEEKFSAFCPELMAPKYNGVFVEGEAEYTIRIHPGVHVYTKEFVREIQKKNRTTYVLVSLGEDEENIKTALNLRTWFEQIGIKPKIQAIVYDSDKKRALSGIRNFKGQPYEVEFIGDLESSYTEKVIIDSELEADALSRHMTYRDEETFWAYEYNYRSSVALAIHSRAKILCGISGADKREEDLTAQERDVLETLEHRRWNAYMRSEGYIFSGSTDPESRNDLAKMHHDLVNFADLSEEEKRKDSAVASKTE